MTEHPLNGERIPLKGGATAWWPCHIGPSSEVGEGTTIGALAHIGQKVCTRRRCRVQGGAYIADQCAVGDEVLVGPNAVILNDKHPPSRDLEKWQPVTVNTDAVIGGNATVIPGNTIGENAVLAAGAVLTKPLPANEVWGGNPAKFMMMRSEYEQRRGE